MAEMIEPQSKRTTITLETANINFCLKAAIDLGSIELRDVEAVLEDYETLAHAVCPKDIESQIILKTRFAHALELLNQTDATYDISKYMIIDVWSQHLNSQSGSTVLEDEGWMVANF